MSPQIFPRPRACLALTLALGAAAVTGQVRASTGGLVEVIQPMMYGESDDISLNAVTYAVDSYNGPGMEMAYIGQANTLMEHGRAINTNVAAMFGVEVRVDWRRLSGPVARVAEGPPVVDTLPVIIDLRKVDAARGAKLTGGLLGARGLERVLAATEAAVFANARHSWPRVRWVRLEVIPKNAARSRVRVEQVEELPRPKTY